MRLPELQTKLAEGGTFEYLPFYGKNNNWYLSQWYPCEFTSWLGKHTSAEDAMMKGKAIAFSDYVTYELMLKTDDPRKLKRLGREVKGFDQKVWNKRKEQIVLLATLNKFRQNPDLKKQLLATGNKVLVEASPYDRIWGVGLAATHDDIENPFRWKGQNLLGFLLMEARDSMRCP